MAKSDDSAKMPSHVGRGLSLFGLFAVLVLIWVPTFWLWPSIDGWALVINTFTSTITFLLVALLQNTDALADLMDAVGADNPERRRARDELSSAVGVEHRESTK